MVDVVSTGAYRQQLLALLPRGPAWPRDGGTALVALLGAFSESYETLDNRAVALLADVRPDTTVDLLADFERVLALPDDCTPAVSTFDARRRAVVDKTTARANISPSAYLDVAMVFGYLDAEILEQHSGAAEAAAAQPEHNIVVTDGKWRYVWWLILGGEVPQVDYLDVLSGVGEALAVTEATIEIACRIRQLAPAHTYPIVTWASPLPAAPASFAAANGAGEVVLTWTAVPQAWATGYEYRRSADGGDTWGGWTQIGGGRAAETVTVSSLAPGTYHFQIRTTFPGSPGESAPSDAVSADVT